MFACSIIHNANFTRLLVLILEWEGKFLLWSWKILVLDFKNLYIFKNLFFSEKAKLCAIKTHCTLPNRCIFVGPSIIVTYTHCLIQQGFIIFDYILISGYYFPINYQRGKLHGFNLRYVIQTILSISNDYVGLFKLVLPLTKVKLPNLSNLVIPHSF